MRWEEWSTWMQIFSPKILSNENLSKNKNLKLTNEENHGKTESFFETPCYCSIMMGLDLLADVFNRVRKKRKDLVFLSIKSLTLGMDPPEM